MAFRVDWTEPARDQLRGIVRAIRIENPSAADRFAVQVITRVDRLERFPRSGAIYRRRRGFEVRQITFRKYRIFYRVRPRLKLVEVLSIWHGARQEPKLGRGK